MNFPFPHFGTALPNPLAMKTEVKIEADEPAPVQHNSSTLAMKDPFAFNQYALGKVLLECLTNTLQMPMMKAPPQLTRFPVLIQDPITLRAFAQFKAGFGDFLKDSLLSTPFYPNPMLAGAKKFEKKVAPTPAPLIAKDQTAVKKEDPCEVKTNCNSCKCGEKCHANDDEKAQKKVPKKKAQNRIKNIPGLIMQRVRSSIKTYFTRNPRFEKQERRLTYVEKVLGTMSKPEKDKILAFLDQYQKNWKTWNTIQKYLQTNPKCGAILLDVVLEFFGNEGLEDFNDWLTSGKMGEKSKKAVTEMKDRIGQKFSKILLTTEEEEDLEANLKDKIVKREEKPIKKEEL